MVKIKDDPVWGPTIGIRKLGDIGGVGEGQISLSAIDGKNKPYNIDPAITNFPLPGFVDATTIEEANQYASNVLGIKFADYTGTDIRIANEWNKGLTIALNERPELGKIIKAVGTGEARYKEEVNYFVNKILMDRKDYYDEQGFSYEKRLGIATKAAKNLATDTPTNNLAFFISGSRSKLDGIFINGEHGYEDYLTLISRNVASGFHPIGTNSIKAQFDHELGHQINIMLNLQENKEFLDIYDSFSKNQIKTGLSRYATIDKNRKVNIDEFIAESWAEYINNPNPRKISKAVGDIIIKMFRK